MKVVYVILLFILSSCFSEEVLNAGLKQKLKFNIIDVEYDIEELNNGRVSANESLIMNLVGSDDFQYSESWLTIPDSIEVDVPKTITNLEVFFTTYVEDLTTFSELEKHIYIYQNVFESPNFNNPIDITLQIVSTEIEVKLTKPERVKEMFLDIEPYIYDKEWIEIEPIQIEVRDAASKIYFPFYIKTIKLTRYVSKDLIIDVNKYMEPGTKNIFNIDNNKARFRIAYDSILIENVFNYKVKD